MDKQPVKKVRKPRKAKQYKKGIDWISVSIDIPILLRVKGRQGLFWPIKGHEFKSGMIGVHRLLRDEKYHVRKTDLERIGGAFIMMQDGSNTPIADAFDNLQKQFKNLPCKVATKDQICPGHNPYEFKDYHASKVIKWYNEIVSAIADATKEESK